MSDKNNEKLAKEIVFNTNLSEFNEKEPFNKTNSTISLRYPLRKGYKNLKKPSPDDIMGYLANRTDLSIKTIKNLLTVWRKEIETQEAEHVEIMKNTFMESEN